MSVYVCWYYVLFVENYDAFASYFKMTFAGNIQGNGCTTKSMMLLVIKTHDLPTEDFFLKAEQLGAHVGVTKRRGHGLVASENAPYRI